MKARQKREASRKKAGANGAGPSANYSLGRVLDVLALLLLAGLGWYAVFDLPYSFPTSVLMRSTSYRVGFNNQVAIFATVAIIGLLFLRTFLSPWFRMETAQRILGFASKFGSSPRGVMPKSLLGFGLVVTVVLTWLFYYCIPDLSSFFEAAVCLPKMELAIHYKMRPYIDVWWPYGPALYYIPLWFMQAAQLFGFSIEDGYVVGHIFLLCAGVWALFYIIDQLRISVMYRCVLFVVLAIASHIWTMGPHTIARHVLPYVLLILIHRVAGSVGVVSSWRDLRKTALYSMCGGLGMLAISPEMGIALLLGLITYFGHSVLVRDRKWIFPLGSSAASLPIWILLFPQCFSFAGSFSAGAGCNPVVPAPHILFYLASLFLVLPVAARAALSEAKNAGAPLLAGWAVMVMATIPPSLSRCDSTHVVWNGIGIFIMAFAAVVRCWPRILPVYSVLMLMILGIAQQFGNATALSGCFAGMRATLAGKRMKRTSEPSPLIRSLGLEGYSSIAAPFGMDHATRTFLFSTHRYAPQYHLDLSCIVSEADTQRILKDLKSASYILVPEGILSFKGAGTEQIKKLKETRQVQRDDEESYSLGTTYFHPFPVHSKRIGFDPEVDLAAAIANDYYLVKKSDGWALMKPL